MYSVCGLRTCQNTLLMRSVQSRVGISIGKVWYCGVDCFAAAASKLFSDLPGTRILEMPHRPRLSIGLALLSKGYLTEKQLRFATGQGRANGEELEATLIRLRLANERQLTVARSLQWGYPILGQDRANCGVESDIPLSLLRHCSGVPMYSSAAAKRLLMGFVHRVDHSLLNSVEQITGFRVEPCFVTPTDLAEQMERLSADPLLEEVLFEDSKTANQRGKTLAALAVDIAAREARFAYCRDYVWIRLSGKNKALDALFRVGREQGERPQNLPVLRNARSMG
jgi:hypothetical protein